MLNWFGRANIIKQGKQKGFMYNDCDYLDNYQEISKWERAELGQAALRKIRQACIDCAKTYAPSVMSEEFYSRINSRRKLFKFLVAVSDLYPYAEKTAEERRQWAKEIMRSNGIKISRDF